MSNEKPPLGKRRFCSCFSIPATQGRGMSLNRCEQRIYDYLQSHPEERQHWRGKFQSAAKIFSDEHELVRRLEPELWRYYEERSSVAEPFKGAARLEGLHRTSMKNLAELLLRLWMEPKPRKKPTEPM